MYRSRVRNIKNIRNVPDELKNNYILINSTNEDVDLSDGQSIVQIEWTQDLNNILSSLPNETQQSLLGVFKIKDSRFFGENYEPKFLELDDYKLMVLLAMGCRCTGFKQIVSDKIDSFFEIHDDVPLSKQELNEVKTDVLSCINDTSFGFCPLNPTYEETLLNQYFRNFFNRYNIPILNGVPYQFITYNGMGCINTLLKYDSDPYPIKTRVFNTLLKQFLYVNSVCVYYNNVCYNVCYFYKDATNNSNQIDEPK